MATHPRYAKFFQTPKSEAETEAERRSFDQHKELISTLPRSKGYCNHGGFWIDESHLLGILSAQKHFTAFPDDIFLCTFVKSGTTWIRALAFAIANRRSTSNDGHQDDHPLLNIHPQDCIPHFESAFKQGPCVPDLGVLPRPRIFASHIPYSLLPDCVKSSCRIVYVSREPKDVLVSLKHFMNAIGDPSMPLEELFVQFCDGHCSFGPVWDHQMEFKRESLKAAANGNNILFLQYEEMKANPGECVRELARFLGMPFTEEEEAAGAVAEIVKLCSIEFLRELDVNKDGIHDEVGGLVIENSSFFRKGEVGGWKEHLSEEMAAKIDQITLQKRSLYGLN